MCLDSATLLLPHLPYSISLARLPHLPYSISLARLTRLPHLPYSISLTRLARLLHLPSPPCSPRSISHARLPHLPCSPRSPSASPLLAFRSPLLASLAFRSPLLASLAFCISLARLAGRPQRRIQRPSRVGQEAAARSGGRPRQALRSASVPVHAASSLGVGWVQRGVRRRSGAGVWGLVPVSAVSSSTVCAVVVGRLGCSSAVVVGRLGCGSCECG